MAAVRVVLGLLLLLLGLAPPACAAEAAACAGEGGEADNEDCTAFEAPRAGGVMLQTAAGAQDKKSTGGTVTEEEAEEEAAAKAKLGPLTLRLDSVQAEITSLQQRVAALETEVLGAAGLAAVQADEQDDAASLLAEAARLRKQSQEPGGTLKDRTAAAEADLGALKSQLSTLENQVRGSDASLLEVKAASAAAGSSLKARVDSLEAEVDSSRTRTSTLEHMVVG